MNELTLIKSADFGGVQCDFYDKDNEPYMTVNQLATCLQFSNGRKGLDNLISRNPRLKSKKFSVTLEMRGTDGKYYNTRLFNEDGIYEVAFLAKTEKAEEFRDWVRTILKSLRSGKAKLVEMSEYQKVMAETRQQNARIRSAQLLTRLAEKYDGTTYQQILNAYATKELTGDFLLPLPQLPEKTYTATEIGNQLGISANMVGILTNRHNLKTDQYGAWYNDKAKKINKEVPTFRYYENVIPVLQSILEKNQTTA